MKTSELKELMPANTADIQGHGIVEFYTPEQVVKILRLLGVVGQSEQLLAFAKWLDEETIDGLLAEPEYYVKRYLSQ